MKLSGAYQFICGTCTPYSIACQLLQTGGYAGHGHPIRCYIGYVCAENSAHRGRSIGGVGTREDYRGVVLLRHVVMLLVVGAFEPG